MFGPGVASGPYTLYVDITSERCIPCERILCERYTSGAALLHSLANDMIADMEDIRGTIYETLFCLACIGHLAHIHSSHAGAALSVVELQRS